MALTDRNILITPSRGATNEPLIQFTGGTASSSASIYLRVLDDGQLSFQGTAGQLMSVQNGLAGTIYTVTDLSGIPSLEIKDDGTVNIAKYQGTVYLGNNTASSSTATGAVQVLGGVGISGNLNIGGSFAMNANLGVGGAGATYGLNVSTTTNLAALFYTGTTNGIAIQTGATPGIGFNSYNVAGTTLVGPGGGSVYNAQLLMNGASMTFNISSAAQAAGATASQIKALDLSSSQVLIPMSTPSSSTATGALVVYGGVGVGGAFYTSGDAYHGAVRVGLGNNSIASNTVLGVNSGANIALGSGGGNTLIGNAAGGAITSSVQNTAIGYQALTSQQGTTTGANTAIGYQAMFSVNNTAMVNNVAIGYRSMGLGNGGFYQNTAIGYNSLANVAGGYSNVAIGYQAGYNIVGGAQNVLIGNSAGSSLGAQNNVVIIGGNSGSTAVTGQIIISDGAGTSRISVDASGNVSVPSTTAANGTAGTGALAVSGGVSVASGLTVGGALYAGGSAGTNGYFLQTTGTGIQWAQAAMTISDDNTTNANRYILFTPNVNGTVTTEYVNSAKLTYVPATGVLGATQFNGVFNGVIGSAGRNAGYFTSLDANNGLSVTAGATAVQAFSAAGIASLNNTTDATAIGTAGTVIAGGASVASQLRVGGNTTIGGSMTANGVINNNPIYYNATAITSNVTISASSNAMSSGPVTINNGVTVTVNGDWSIV